MAVPSVRTRESAAAPHCLVRRDGARHGQGRGARGRGRRAARGGHVPTGLSGGRTRVRHAEAGPPDCGEPGAA